MEDKYVVVVVGGAVAGSEAVFQLREKGIAVICIDQNPLPFGKIEDGLPRWHAVQREKEYGRISDKLDHSLVHFVPNTKVGETLTFKELHKEWGASAILLANGAWRDRPLPVEGVDEYIGKGLVYQNPLVYWFNHYHEPHYKGERYEIPDNAIVIGGGLASLDVMKICQMEITMRALRERGIQVEMIEMEKVGIPKTLEKHGLKWEDLGLRGTDLYYRRRAIDMPLAETPPNATPEQEEKIENLRKKILSNYATKFGFVMNDTHLPTAPIVENGKMVGLKFTRTEVINKKAKPVPNTDKEVRANMIISSIGSIPEVIPGLPSKWETYEVESVEHGIIKGMPTVRLLGNAVTGKGNIRLSMIHARQVAKEVAEELIGDPSRKVPPPTREKIMARVKELQKKAGYDGNFREWVKKEFDAR